MDTRRFFGLKALLLGVILFGSLGKVTAQAPAKIGHFDTRYVFSNLPEYTKVQNALEIYKKQLLSEVTKKQKELQAKAAEYQKLATAKPPTPVAILKARENEINKLDQELRQFQQAARQQVVQKENALVSPVSKKVQNAIDKVAKAGNFAMIIKKEALLFETPGDNISKLVLKELGVVVVDKKENK